MYPDSLTRALNVLGRGLHPKKREALAEVEARLKGYHDSQMDLLGPGHVPPPSADTRSLDVAKPAITASYWQDGPWHCLRIEERTVGHNRPRAWFNKAAGYPQLRQDPATEQWMNWVRKIAQHFGIQPLEGSVRMVFFPGLVYTFAAWRAVEQRQPALLHPMDNDNLAKASIDALMPQRREPDEEGAKPRKPRKKAAKDDALTGGYLDDRQIVDLLVFRLPQEGKPAVDRLALHRQRSATRKTTMARIKAKKDAEARARSQAEEQKD